MSPLLSFHNELVWVPQDFTTFTEVEDGMSDNIQVIADIVTFEAYDNRTTYLYKDYGAGNFAAGADFTHYFQLTRPSSHVASRFAPWMLANDLGDIQWMQNNNKENIRIEFTGPGLRVLQLTGAGVETNSAFFDVTYGTTYYVSVEKNAAGPTLTFSLYDSWSMRNVIGTKNLAIDLVGYRYLYMGCTHNDGSAVHGHGLIYDLGLS